MLWSDAPLIGVRVAISRFAARASSSRDGCSSAKWYSPAWRPAGRAPRRGKQWGGVRLGGATGRPRTALLHQHQQILPAGAEHRSPVAAAMAA